MKTDWKAIIQKTHTARVHKLKSHKLPVDLKTNKGKYVISYPTTILKIIRVATIVGLAAFQASWLDTQEGARGKHDIRDTQTVSRSTR